MSKIWMHDSGLDMMSFYVNLLLAELFGWQWSNLYAAWNKYVNIYYFWYFIFLSQHIYCRQAIFYGG